MVGIQKCYREYFQGYDTGLRVSCYRNQIKEVSALQPSNVLEIGIGNGYVSNKLRKKGFDVLTADFDFHLEPDVVANILSLPMKDDSCDVLLCAEVLEHMHFRDSVKALEELHRVAGRYVVLTLPQSNRPLWYRILFLRKTLFKKPIGEHYWEVGWLGFSQIKLVSAIKNAGFEVIKNYAFPASGDYRYRFIVLKKNFI